MPLTPHDAEDRAPDVSPQEDANAVVDYVDDNPILALLVAAAFGFVLGRLLF